MFPRLKDALVRQKAISSELISFTPAQMPPETVGGFVGIGLIASPDEITDEYDMQLVSSFFDQKAALTTGTLVENEHPAIPEQRYVRKVLRFTITDVVQTGVYEFDQSFVYVPIEALSTLLYPDKKTCADAIQIRLVKGTNEEVAMAMIRGAWMDFAKDRLIWATGATVESSRKMQARLIGEYRKQLNMLMLIFGIVSFGVVLLVFCIFYLIVMTTAERYRRGQKLRRFEQFGGGDVFVIRRRQRCCRRDDGSGAGLAGHAEYRNGGKSDYRDDGPEGLEGQYVFILKNSQRGQLDMGRVDLPGGAGGSGRWRVDSGHCRRTSRPVKLLRYE